MFDWDKDYADLVEGPGHGALTDQTLASQIHCASVLAAVSDRDKAEPHFLRRHFMTLVLGAMLVGGIAFEKADAMKMLGKAAATGDVFSLVAPQELAKPLPEGLVVYQEGEYRRFMLGLRGLSVQELDLLRQTTRADLHAAPDTMAPYFHDALLLLEREIVLRAS